MASLQLAGSSQAAAAASAAGIARLDDDLDLAAARVEARIRADQHAGMALGHRLEHADDPALGRPVRPPPGPDRLARPQLLGERVEHRLHLGRQARAGRRRCRSRTRARRRAGSPAAGSRRAAAPTRDVLGIAPEAGAQAVGDVGLLDLRHAERGGDRLARDVVGRPAEPAGDEHDVGRRRLLAHEGRDLLDLVGHDGDQRDRDAERREPPREPAPFVFSTSPETSSFPIVTIAARGTRREYTSVLLDAPETLSTQLTWLRRGAVRDR